MNVKSSPGPARKHHYVPRFILRPWTKKDGNLWGYYWNKFNQNVQIKKLGVSAFCHKLDLLSVEFPVFPPDALENEFFGRVDDRGAKVVDKLINAGPAGLSAGERSDFARLLMSLEARRPVNVAIIKEKGPTLFRNELDHDPEIVDALKREGIEEKPTDYCYQLIGVSPENHALLKIRPLVDNLLVGNFLVNAHWRMYHLGSRDGSLVLSDRPLILTGRYDCPETIWALPLSPRTLFIATGSQAVIQEFDRMTCLQLRKRMNESSLNQVDRYVFMIDETNLPLVSKRLKLHNKEGA